MKKHVLSVLGTALFISLLLMSSCKKDDNTVTSNPVLTYTKEDNQVDSYLDEVSSEVDEITLTASSKSYGYDSSVDQGSKGRRIRKTYRHAFENGRVDTIVYENFVNGRSQFNKRVKNGMIIITQTGGPLQDTFVRVITFKNFTVNGNQIEGTRTITKIGPYKFSITFEGKITFKDGTTYTRTSSRTRTWIAGYDTPFNVWDDVYSIEGTASGVNRHGLSYTHTITTPLIVKMSCPYIVAGTIEFTVGSKTVIVNYGDENSPCDANITVTVDGEVTQLQLSADE